MKLRHICVTIVGLALTFGAAGSIDGADAAGRVKVGFVALDEEGSQAVYQPNFNVYKGAVVSLEDFSYQFGNGTRFMADLQNLTMNNRRLMAGITRSGRYGITIRNNQYRRTYAGDGGQFTRRRTTSGEFWVQPHQYFRFFGGYGRTAKHGTMVELFEPLSGRAAIPVKYTQEYFHAGLRVKHGRRLAQLEYRGSDFTEEYSLATDRTSRRFRVTASSPIPRYDKIVVSAGFQHYTNALTNLKDTLTTNTGWGALRYFVGQGFSLRYNFVFDRSRRTGDLSAADNISNAVFASKAWPGKAGLTVGYRQRLNDDVRDEVSSTGFTISTWYRPVEKVTVNAGYGSENKQVDNGRTLTGDADYTRYSTSLQYDFGAGSRARLKYFSRQTENDQIGSSAEYSRLGGDLWFRAEKYGDLQVSYSFLDGEYENAAGTFNFGDHVLSGDLTSVEYTNVQVGFGGSYFRSKEDLDAEHFSVRFTAGYAFPRGHRLEVKYTAHNFDNLADTSPVYTEFYTANVVEVYLTKEF